MKFESSTLFVNTGRKALPAMQKKKKTSKNNVVLAFCIVIIAVLCVFVGMIWRAWFSYSEDGAKETSSKVQTVEKSEPIQKPQEEEKPKKEEEKPKKKMSYTSKGKETKISKAAKKAFANVEDTYSFGILNLADGYEYIQNTDKIYNSAALGAFLMEYASEGIYMGTFDYTTNVFGYSGSHLMNRAFAEGSIESANLLIEYFGADNLNAYFASKGYKDTFFGGTIGNTAESYTSTADVIKLIKKMYDNANFFPYSDMYQKMLSNSTDDKIAKLIPQGTNIANISFATEEEVFDAAVVYTPEGAFVFTAMANEFYDSPEKSYAAISAAAKGIYGLIK